MTRRAPSRFWGAAIFFSAVSMAPDADVVAFALKIPYGDPWGHRGASHAIIFAGLVSLVFGAAHLAFSGAAKDLRRTGLWTLAFFGVMASHGLLDTLTDGGLGAALLWPLDNTRYFAPIRPIPVAPIGRGFISKRGMIVAGTELLMFAPLLMYALWPRKAKPAKV